MRVPLQPCTVANDTELSTYKRLPLWIWDETFVGNEKKMNQNGKDIALLKIEDHNGLIDLMVFN